MCMCVPGVRVGVCVRARVLCFPPPGPGGATAAKGAQRAVVTTAAAVPEAAQPATGGSGALPSGPASGPSGDGQTSASESAVEQIDDVVVSLMLSPYLPTAELTRRGWLRTSA